MNFKNQQLIKASVVIVIMAGIFGALSVTIENIGQATGKLFAICMSIILFGMTAVISMIAGRKPENKNLGIAGIIISGIAFLLVFTLILTEFSNDIFLKIVFSFFISAIAIAHINLLHYFNLQNKYALYARITATTAIVVFSLFIITQVFSPFPNFNSFTGNQAVYKLIIAALIIDLSATLLVPLCNNLEVAKPTELTFNEEHDSTGEENISAE